MSVEIMTNVWKRSTQKGSALLMLLALADIADDQGYCWPSIPYLASKTRLSERQAARILHGLEGSGDIVIENRRRGNDSQMSNGYQLVKYISPPDKMSPPPDKMSPPPVIGVTPPPSSVSPLDPSLDTSIDTNNNSRARAEKVPDVPALPEVEPEAVPDVPAQDWQELQNYFIEKTGRFPSGAAQINEPKWKRPLLTILAASGGDAEQARVRIDHGISVALGQNKLGRRYHLNNPASILNAALNYDPNPQGENGRAAGFDKGAMWDHVVQLMGQYGRNKALAALAAMNPLERRAVEKAGGFIHLCGMALDPARIRFYQALNEVMAS